ncbi:MAG: T9SS type A sorting domain-containing protein [Terrimonas sp.]|nr:T9SS type A sorting domain-containing protein [Terrimonas sp.]
MNKVNPACLKKKPISARTSAFLSIFFLFFSVAGFAQTMQTTQKSVYTKVAKYVGGYMESVPNDYYNNPTKKYPLLIFLHGIGERGDGTPGVLERVTNVGIAKLLKDNAFPASFAYGGSNYSFIVLSPQISGSAWDQPIADIIAFAKQNYRVDEQRIYVTGLSMGGISLWAYATQTAARGKELAAMLLCTPGTGYTSTQLSNLSSAQLPVWVTNNTGDPYNPASGATALVNAINSTVPAPPKALLTIFTKSGHDCWTATYNPAFKQDGLNVYEWMLSKSRGSVQQAPAKPVLTASAGANQIITLPTNTVTLDASGSKVTSGSITSYSWTKVSGPTTGTLTLISNGLQAKLTDLVAGVYVYQLTVKDSNGSTATANVTVTVNAATTSTAPPTANAGKEQTITLPTNSCTLNGSLSSASTGNTIVSYKWTKMSSSPSAGAITNPSSVSTTVTGLVEGVYTFSLTVTDSRGVSVSGGTIVTVKAGTTSTNVAPTAVANGGGAIQLPTNSRTLSGTASTPAPGSSIASYSWSKVSGPTSYKIANANAATTEFSNLVEGVYVFRLTVTDKNGLSSSADAKIVVQAAADVASTAPTAVANGGGVIQLPTNSRTLSGTASTPAPGSSIASYSWSKVSGPTSYKIANANAATTEFSNLAEGVYVFRLTVTDKNGLSSSADAKIVVQAAADVAPTAVANGGGVIQLPTNSKTLSGTASTPAPGSSIASYYWSKVSGPSSYTIANPNAAETVFSNLAEGVYVFRLTITDKNGLSSTADAKIVVQSAATANRTMGSDDNASIALAEDNIIRGDESSLNFKVSPNPVQSDMNIAITGGLNGKASITVYNISGKQVLQQEFVKDGNGTLNKGFNLSRLPRGIYVVQVAVDGKYKKAIRIVKQ